MNDTTRAQIARINDLGQVARTSWLSLLAFLGFVGVTLLGVQDADFFVPSRETSLPLVAVRIPTASFFWFAPTLSAALYVNLHMHLLKLWDAIAEAPHQIDGAPLGDYLHAWFGTDLALDMKGEGALRRRPMSWLNHLVTRALVWIAGPLIIAGFWWRSMPAHDLGLTLTAAASLLIALYAGLTSWWHAVARLRRPWIAAWSAGWIRALSLAALIALPTISWLTTERDLVLDPATPWIGRWLGDRSTLVPAQLTGVKLVDLPAGWMPPEPARLEFRADWCDQEGIPDAICDRPPQADRPVPPRVLAEREEWCAEYAPGKPCAEVFAEIDDRFYYAWEAEREAARVALGHLDLARRDLRRAAARDSTLVGAALNGARLNDADLRFARLEGANLRDADLRGALLRNAELRDATLTGARLEGADLREAGLENTLLPDAQFQGADLSEARLEWAYLLNARLDRADLGGARLEFTDLTVASLAGADLRNARLTGADLRGARLDGADLRWSDLRSIRWSGATTGAGPVHFADLRGAADLAQAQLDTLVGNAGTLLPDHPAPDTGRPYRVWSCWPAPPADFEALLTRLTRDAPENADNLRASLLCSAGRTPEPTGTSCALDTPRARCAAGSDRP